MGGANLKRDGVDLQEDLQRLELRDGRFLQGQTVDTVRLREAVLAGRLREGHDVDMSFHRQGSC